MANFTRQVDFLGKAQSGALVEGSDFDSEFDELATTSATKMDQVSSPTDGNIVTLSATGQAEDSGIALSGSRLKVLSSTELVSGISPNALTWTEITSSTLANNGAEAGFFKVVHQLPAPGLEEAMSLFIRKKGSAVGVTNNTRVMYHRWRATGSGYSGTWYEVAYTLIPVDSDGKFEIYWDNRDGALYFYLERYIF